MLSAQAELWCRDRIIKTLISKILLIEWVWTLKVIDFIYVNCTAIHQNDQRIYGTAKKSNSLKHINECVH